MAARKSQSIGDLGVGGSGPCSRGKRRLFIFLISIYFKCQVREEGGRRAGSKVCVCDCVNVWRHVSWTKKEESITVFLPPL